MSTERAKRKGNERGKSKIERRDVNPAVGSRTDPSRSLSLWDRQFGYIRRVQSPARGERGRKEEDESLGKVLDPSRDCPTHSSLETEAREVWERECGSTGRGEREKEGKERETEREMKERRR